MTVEGREERLAIRDRQRGPKSSRMYKREQKAAECKEGSLVEDRQRHTDQKEAETI